MSVYEAVRPRLAGSLSSLSNLFDRSDRARREEYDQLVTLDEEVGAPSSPSAHSSPVQPRASGGEWIGTDAKGVQNIQLIGGRPYTRQRHQRGGM